MTLKLARGVSLGWCGVFVEFDGFGDGAGRSISGALEPAAVWPPRPLGFVTPTRAPPVFLFFPAYGWGRGKYVGVSKQKNTMERNYQTEKRILLVGSFRLGLTC